MIWIFNFLYILEIYLEILEVIFLRLEVSLDIVLKKKKCIVSLYGIFFIFNWFWGILGKWILLFKI